jgi:hypothetical protein
MVAAVTDVSSTLRRAVAAVRAGVTRRVGVDPRALAGMRITLGTLLFADLLLRSRYLVAFYTDNGVLPRATLRATRPTLAAISLHAQWGSATAQAVLFAVGALAALAVALGYRTRLATLVSFLLLLSLHARNPVVLNGGDSLLRRALLWGVFLPLGTRWSLDAIRREASNGSDTGGRGATGPVATVATAGLLLQPVFVYGTNAVVKLRGDAWPSGRAVRYVFHIDRFTVFLGEYLVDAAAVLTLIDWLWLTLLVASPFLLLTTDRVRTALAGAFAGGHLSMALTMRLGLFPLIAVGVLLPYVHDELWDWLEAMLPTERLRTAGEIAVGDRSVGADDGSPSALQPLRARLHTARSRLHTARSGPRTVRTRLHTARSRLRTVRTGLHHVGRVVATLLLVFVLVWNAAALGYVEIGGQGSVNPERFRWDMFAPSPPKEVVWFVGAGTLEDGTRVDAYADKELDWDRPPEVTRNYPSVRWRKYLVSLYWDREPRLNRALAAHFCSRWNRTHETKLRNVSVYAVTERISLDGEWPPERNQLVTHECRG